MFDNLNDLLACIGPNLEITNRISYRGLDVVEYITHHGSADRAPYSCFHTNIYAGGKCLATIGESDYEKRRMYTAKTLNILRDTYPDYEMLFNEAFDKLVDCTSGKKLRKTMKETFLGEEANAILSIKDENLKVLEYFEDDKFVGKVSFRNNVKVDITANNDPSVVSSNMYLDYYYFADTLTKLRKKEIACLEILKVNGFNEKVVDRVVDAIIEETPKEKKKKKLEKVKKNPYRIYPEKM